MASVPERLEEALEREAPTWGIRPVPPGLRRFSGIDLAILWGDLAIGLLVLVTGALLVPSLGLPSAVVAIVVGTRDRVHPARAGRRRRRAGGACRRWSCSGLSSASAGRTSRRSRTSCSSSGWTAFEFWAMGRVANAVSIDLFGVDAYLAWLVVVAVGCTALALAGPIFAVRRWLERFGVWIVAGVAIWITVKVVAPARTSARCGRGRVAADCRSGSRSTS